jgi:Flp pilus assembly protein TadB
MWIAAVVSSSLAIVLFFISWLLLKEYRARPASRTLRVDAVREDKRLLTERRDDLVRQLRAQPDRGEIKRLQTQSDELQRAYHALHHRAAGLHSSTTEFLKPVLAVGCVMAGIWCIIWLARDTVFSLWTDSLAFVLSVLWTALECSRWR